MNTVLWIVQGLLAAMFLMGGLMKSTQPLPKLVDKLGDWVNEAGQGQVRLAGASEVAAAVGLTLPGLTGIGGILTPIAAVGLCAIMVLAARLHLKRQEPQMAAFNGVLFAAAAFVAYGRFVVVPF